MEILGLAVVVGTISFLGKLLLVMLPYAALVAIFQKGKEKDL
jgi:uncharacterized membrane protein YccC